MKKQSASCRYLILAFVVASVFLFLGIMIGLYSQETRNESFSYNTVNMILPAVDEKGNGVITTLTVQTIPGNGKLLTNIDKLLFWIDTQDSIQTASMIAKDVTGIKTDNIDIIYSIVSDNATLVGGPSAGAAITIATIAALKNITLPKDIIITGTIEDDGSIGQVGGIIAKAKASKAAGARLFLVPKSEMIEEKWLPKERCIRQEIIEYCEIRYEKQLLNVTEIAGVETREVKDIYEAMKYFGL